MDSWLYPVTLWTVWLYHVTLWTVCYILTLGKVRYILTNGQLLKACHILDSWLYPVTFLTVGYFLTYWGQLVISYHIAWRVCFTLSHIGQLVIS